LVLDIVLENPRWKQGKLFACKVAVSLTHCVIRLVLQPAPYAAQDILDAQAAGENIHDE
jgi:hypothetical protein